MSPPLQGRVIPCDFIGIVRSQQSVYLKGEIVSNHDELMSNFFAQVHTHTGGGGAGAGCVGQDSVMQEQGRGKVTDQISWQRTILFNWTGVVSTGCLSHGPAHLPRYQDPVTHPPLFMFITPWLTPRSRFPCPTG
jgi:hypothetical protein